MSLSKENLPKKTIEDLPDEVLEFILSLVSSYKDSDSCKLVCKRWHKIINYVSQHSKFGLYRSILNSDVIWQCIVPTSSEPTPIIKRYSHAACYCDSYMYVFGGCTSRCTTFNDLWTLDLSKRKWIRPLTTGSYPSPKACATLCCYQKSLILFGGWTHPPSYPLHQTIKLFNELHVFNIPSNKWTVIHLPLCPPPMAGHSATIHGNMMIVFGGLQRDDTTFFYRSSNNVWCYNLETECWIQPETSNPKPSPRYGQSQIFLDDNNILIIGGCEGPNAILNDVWLLSMTSSIWVWQQIRVNNLEWAPPHLWCHTACRVGNAVVVFSRGSTQSGSQYSLCSTTDSEMCMEDTSIPPEVVARITSQNQLSYVNMRDINVNGQRGNLGKTIKSLDEPSTSSSSTSSSSFNEYFPKIKEPNSNKNNISQNFQQKGPQVKDYRCRKKTDLQMAAFQDENTFSKSPSSTKNRKKQLECLRRMEEKYKNHVKEEEDSKKNVSKENNNSNDIALGISSTCNAGNKMNMFVMDISKVLKEACVAWRRPRYNSKAPRERILYSLVLGKGELIIFGGIQKSPSVAFPINSNKCVLNTTHVITAPHNII